MAFRSGTRVRSLEVISLLGSGGRGEVYCTRDAEPGIRSALTVLPEALFHNGERLSLFRRGAQVTAALDHPYIAVYHCPEEAGVRRLVMELVEETTLAGPLGAILPATPRPFSRGRIQMFDWPTKVTLWRFHPNSGEDRCPSPQVPD